MEVKKNEETDKSKFLYDYDDGKINWKIKLYKNKEEIVIEVEDIVTMLEIYKNSFNLSSFYEKDDIFKKAKTLDGVFSFLIHNFENKKIAISKNEKNCLLVQIKYNLDFFGENIIELPLTKIEIDSNIIAQKALDISLNFNKDIITLKKENAELKKEVENLTIKLNDLTGEFHKHLKEIIIQELFNFNKSKICETEEEIDFLKKMLPGKKLNLLYRATEHGDSVSTFHSKCDNKGENIVFYKTNKNKKLEDILVNLGNQQENGIKIMETLISFYLI